ncbi:MAG: DUF4440 domain-containing protein [bacterium]|nr:DUF4440 domain-containing protein [bacterium]
MRSILLTIALAAAIAAPCSAHGKADPAVVARVNQLLDAYSQKQIGTVMAMLDPGAAMYGTALKEFYTTPRGIAALLSSDYRQWNSSRFGAPRNVTTEASGDLQSVFFDAPFAIVTAEGRKRAFTVRFATVWHRDPAGQWRLIQSMNAVVQ